MNNSSQVFGTQGHSGQGFVEIDEDVLKFLKRYCFPAYVPGGKDSKKDDSAMLLNAASSRAYLDFCRTFHYDENADKKAKGARKQQVNLAKNKLHTEIKNLLKRKSGNCTQECYDEWHKKLCQDLKGAFQGGGEVRKSRPASNFTIGQAQKWVNMTMKNLYALGMPGIAGFAECFHAPVDNFIIEKAKELGVSLKGLSPEATSAWSKWENYDETYLAFQKQLRERVKDESVFRWEIRAWNTSAGDKTDSGT